MPDEDFAKSVGEGGVERHLKQAQRENLSPESDFHSKILEASALRSEVNNGRKKEDEIKEFAMKVRSAWKVAESIMVINDDAGIEYINKIIDDFVEKGLFDKLRNEKMFYRYVNANPHRREHYFTPASKFPIWEDILKVLFRIDDIYYSGDKRTLSVDRARRSYKGD
ncbi:MAG: hypothetical protein ACOCTK_02090 [Candidatus Saliniplasma sp.]